MVVLLQGFFQTRGMWTTMERRLRADGFAVASFHLGGLLRCYNTHPIDRSAALIGSKIEGMAARFGFDKVHLVGHSKGGLIARRFVQRHGGASWVRSLITLGTPHAGARIAAVTLPFSGFGLLPTSAPDLLPGSTLVQSLRDDAFPTHIPFTSIYSPGDLICSVRSARAIPRTDRASAVEVPGLGHSELAWDPSVYAIVRQRLAAAATPAPLRAHPRSCPPSS